MHRLRRGFLDHLIVERGLSKHTVAAYRQDLTRYLTWLIARGITDPEEIAPADIIAYQAEITGGDIDHPALAPASVARAVVAIRALHAFAFAEGLVTHNAAAEINPPSPGKRLPKGLSIDEVQRLLDAVDRDSWVGLRDAALLELLYGTGARIGEVVALDVDDLTRVLGDPEASLRLIGKGDRERLVPLGSYARAAVEAWLVRGRPVVLASARQSSPALLLNTRGRRLSRQSAWAIMQYRARMAGLTTSAVSPHSLRHSFATHLLDGGADVRVVQEFLGHASVTTTQIYTQVTVDHLREVFAVAHPRARG